MDNHDELRRWLESHGLDDAEVLVVLSNEELEAMAPEVRRLLHGLLEARYQLDHPELEDQKLTRRLPPARLEEP